MAVPTGRYTFYLQGDPYTVKINRKESGRRWTTVSVWAETGWIEVLNPDHKKAILRKLNDPNTDLVVASYLYTRMHNKCGACGNHCDPEHGHTVCLAQKFGKEVLANG